MYQYTATIKESQKIIGKGHNVSDVEKEVVRFVRANKRKDLAIKGIVVIHHLQRNKNTGEFKKKLIKEIVI